MEAAYYQQILDEQENSNQNQDLFDEVSKANDLLKRQKIRLLEKLDDQRENILRNAEEIDFNDAVLNGLLDDLSDLEKELMLMDDLLKRFVLFEEKQEEPNNLERKNVFKAKFKKINK